jgi:hypothetical protein
MTGAPTAETLAAAHKGETAARVESARGHILAVRHALHAHPEPGWQEHRSVELLEATSPAIPNPEEA